MNTSRLWPTLLADMEPMEQLIGVSQFYGSDPQYALAGGGNTSWKTEDTLYVKASGHALATIEEAGFVALHRAPLDALLESYDPHEPADAREERFKEATHAARVYPEKGQRPSVECVLHHILPGAYTVHTHPTVLNALTCLENGEEVARELYGANVLWLPYMEPGFVLAHALYEGLARWRKETGGAAPDAVLMGNHGLFVSANTPDAIRNCTDDLCEKLLSRRGPMSETSFGALTHSASSVDRIAHIAPYLRGLLADGDTLPIVTFEDGPLAVSLTCGADGKAAALAGPLIPDQIVYCKSLPMWVCIDDTETALETLREAVLSYREAHGYPPKVVLVEGLGLFAAGDTYRAAATVRDVYLDAIQIMMGARALGTTRYMSQEERDFIENWEVEQYRRKIAAGSGQASPVANKVALVTGAAQGFGLEIAQGLVAHGAHVVLADLNQAGVEAAAAALNEKHGAGRATGLVVNVTDGDAIRVALQETIRRYGGLDLLVSNAGVLKAGSVKLLPLKDFDFVTQVNYTGYFLCVQHTVPILARQHAAKPGYWSDILQINSKSGLEGSNKNAAYAGSKFGGIGLTQSFALELVEDGVKVNSICPGNFLDGPLWSDPDNGLFVQYLRTGKVPGAKTLEDVRAAYEAKVPIGRGCRTEDVLKAVLYAVDQRYETGQAIPVTGGQSMLR